MIQEFVDKYMAREQKMRDFFKKKQPKDYKEIVTQVISLIAEGYEDEGEWRESNIPDHTRIHEIDDGEWQGTLLYLIAASNDQPEIYWFVKVYYGSCSGCDTLERIRDYSEELPNQEQIDQYMILALHIVQKLKIMQTEEGGEG